MLKVSMKVQGILADVDLVVPMFIGTIPQSEGNGNPVTITYPNPADDTNICDDRE